MKASDRYVKLVEWSDEDQCYVGTCPGLMLGGIHGDDEAKVYRELCQAVDEWVAVHREDHAPLPPATAGKAYSGKFVMRVGKELHRELAAYALRDGKSLNAYCVGVLKERQADYGEKHTGRFRKEPSSARKMKRSAAKVLRKSRD